ncbi:unnamed protein product [Merluccius merluccius]
MAEVVGGMQTRYDRLATYLEEVRTLEAANADLELKDLPIVNVTNVNNDLCLAIHDPTLTTDDFRTKYESKLNMSRSVEMDIAGLKGLLSGGGHHQGVSTETINMSKTEITELSCMLQALQIELQTQLSMLSLHKSLLEGTLPETEARNSSQLQAFQFTETSLEEQLVNLRADIDRQGQEYQMLLDAKTRLEMEIAEHRRLLDGEASGGGSGGDSSSVSSSVSTSKTAVRVITGDRGRPSGVLLLHRGLAAHCI